MNSYFSILFIFLFSQVHAQVWSSAGSVDEQVYGFGQAYGNFYAGCFTNNSPSTSSQVLFEQSNGTWSAVPGATNFNAPAFVIAIKEYQNQLYIGGNFSTFNPPHTAYSLARDVSGTWQPLDTGFTPGTYIYALEQFNNKLYASGIFTAAGSAVTTGIAEWNGSSWAKLGSQGLAGTGFGRCMKVYKNGLYVGGNFSGAGGVPLTHIAKWNGSNWFPVGAGISGFNTLVTCMEVYNDELYAAGHFMFAGGDTATGIARWNGTSWDDVSSGFFTSYIYDLEVYQGELYAVGDFTAIGGVDANKIARWNGGTWSALGSGLQLNSTNAFGSALCARPDGLYVGGFFSSAGNVPTSNIAKWTMPPSGVKEGDIHTNIRIFPTPAGERLTVELPQGQNTNAFIYDQLGRLVLTKSIQGHSEIDVNGFAPGVYVLKCEGEWGNSAQRFAIMR